VAALSHLLRHLSLKFLRQIILKATALFPLPALFSVTACGVLAHEAPSLSLSTMRVLPLVRPELSPCGQSSPLPRRVSLAFWLERVSEAAWSRLPVSALPNAYAELRRSSPEPRTGCCALPQRCVAPSIRSATTLAVFNQFCYVPRQLCVAHKAGLKSHSCASE
jgi:hypothetical protein